MRSGQNDFGTARFPGWDYVNEEFDKAGITDIREQRDLLRKYEEERARKADNGKDPDE